MSTIESDAYVRMLNYRALIMRQYPETRLTQCAVLLGRGNIRMHDDPENGFSLGLKVVSLPTTDREEFLGPPSLSPLAQLAAGDEVTRKQSALAALKMIDQLPLERQSGMREAAFNLAPISLAPSTIDAIRKELKVTMEEVIAFYDKTEIGQEYRRLSFEKGRKEGLVEALSGLLRGRFGSDHRIPAIADALVHRVPEIDPAMEMIGDATSLDDVLPHRLPFF